MPPEVRTIIYATNAIESLHVPRPKIVRNRGHFPSDEAASKLLCATLRNVENDWELPQLTCMQAANEFAIMVGERFTNALTYLRILTRTADFRPVQVSRAQSLHAAARASTPSTGAGGNWLGSLESVLAPDACHSHGGFHLYLYATISTANLATEAAFTFD